MGLEWTTQIYPITAFFGIVLLVVLLVYFRHRLHSPQGKVVVFLLAIVIGWIFSLAAVERSTVVEDAIFWSNLAFSFEVFLPGVWLIFALVYAGRQDVLSLRAVFFINAIPLAMVILNWTNMHHGLVWSWLEPSLSGEIVEIQGERGLAGWGYLFYSHGSILLGLAVIFWHLLNSKSVYRWQAIILFLGVLIPYSAMVADDLNQRVVLGVDYAALASVLAVLILPWTLFFRFKLGDLIPVARSKVLESMEDGVIVLDEQNRVVDINPVARRLLVLKDGEGIGMQIQTLWPEALEAVPDPNIGEVRAVEKVFQEAGGESIYEMRVSSLQDRRGASVGQVLVLRDITARKNAEKELRRFRKFHETLLGTMIEGIVVEDPDGQLIYGNQAAETMLGYQSAELTTKHWTSIVPADQIPIVDAANRRRTRGVADRYEIQLQRKDGSLLDVLVSGTPRFRDGIFDGTIAVFTDISELKSVEAKLHRRWEELEALREASLAMSAQLDLRDLLNVVVDQGCKLLDVPHGALFLWKVEIKELELIYGRGFSESYKGLRLKKGEDLAGGVLGELEPITMDESMLRDQSSDLWDYEGLTSAMGVPLLLGNQPIGVLVFADSRSGHSFGDHEIGLCSMFANQAAFAISNAQLFGEVQHWAQELASSNAELEHFAYVASHDLQEPLRMVTSYLQLLERRYAQELDIDGVEFIDFAVDGANRMRDLINGLLTYSRVGRRGVEYTRVETDQVVGRALANLKVMVDESGAQVKYNGLPNIVADETQMIQLFQNLIGNAVKFRSETSPLVEVAADQGEEAWTFAIRDNGIGIEASFLEKIFLIFQRLHTRAEYPGAGIGLAVCKKIVEGHGGKIWAESEPKVGSTFYFTLPLREL